MKLVPGEALRHLFFTGKGGVGKTSVASATAVELADLGRRVLLVSTDPASNLDEVLGVELGPRPVPVPGAPGLDAMNLDPEAAARAYRERVLGPVRGRLPEAALRSAEEQLSGACTVEIAAFDEFARLIGDPSATAQWDHVVFDTAPTGHTLRLIQLPAAWGGFLASSGGSAGCLGPLAGLEQQRSLYASAVRALADASATAIVLVARPDTGSLAEAERTRVELGSIGVADIRLAVNGVFRAASAADPLACEIERRGAAALAGAPAGLSALPSTRIDLRRAGIVGLPEVRAFLRGDDPLPAVDDRVDATSEPGIDALAAEIAATGHGAVLTVGKGGVGKTTVARRIADALAARGFRTHLTTTDPAGRDARAQPGGAPVAPGLRTSRIDADAETRAYAAEVLAEAGADLDEDSRALLEEDLRSPCTQEIAVFRAFARVVADGVDGFVVVDTAPTGHTLLLLDAAEAYHREVQRTRGALPDAVRNLLPRLRDPSFTRVVIVTLPEATPVHEAAALQADLRRAGIEPFAWVVNQSLSPVAVSDPLLVARRAAERRHIEEVRRIARRVFVEPFRA